MEPAYIFWTAANVEEARAISIQLLSQKLIACASIIPKVHSLFIWKEKLEETVEAKVIFKTIASNFAKINEFIDQNAGYEVSEIVLMKWEDANNSYLDWLKSTL